MVVLVFLAHQLNRALVGAGVPDVFAVHLRDVGAAEEVDELLGVLLVAGGLEDDRAVHPDVRAFRGHEIVQMVVQVDGVLCVARPHQRERRFASHHLILRFVHLIRLDNAGLLLLNQLILRCHQLRNFAAVHGIAEVLQRDAHAVAVGVQHEHVLLVLRVPEDAPRLVGFGNHVLVVQDADRSPHIRHGVLVLRVVVGIAELVDNLLEIRHVFVVDFRQQILGDHALDDVVGREAHVERTGVRLDLHNHVLIRGEAHVVDLDARLFGEEGQDFGCDVVLPVVDVDDLFREGGGGDGQRQAQEHQQGKQLFHQRCSSFKVIGGLVIIRCGAAVDNQQQHQQSDEHERRQCVERRLDAAAGGGVNQRGQILHQRGSREVADGEVVQREGERQHRPGDDARHTFGDDDVEQRVHRRCAKVKRRFIGVSVHLLELRQHRQDDVGRIERDVRQQHRHIAAVYLREEEQQHQADAGHDVGHGVGQVRQRHHERLRPLLHGVDANGGERSQNRRDDHGQQGNCHRDGQRVHDARVLK